MLKSFLRNESGNMAVMSSVVILTLLTGVGAAIDISNVISHKTTLQDANDTATLAAISFGAKNQNISDTNSLDVFNLNQSQSRLQNTQYNLSFDNDRIIGTATADYPLFFANILPQATIPIRVRTVVARTSTQGTLCIKALSTNAQNAFRLNGGARVLAPACEVEVDTLTTPSANINSGITLDVQKVCVAGSRILNNSGSSNSIETNCQVNPDPYLNRFPIPDDRCDYQPTTHQDRVVNLQPGVYCGGTNFGPSVENVRFAPGLYVIKDGGWTIDAGRWEGDGVTFYFMDQRSGIQFNSGISARMTPPTSGLYKDVFITEAPNTLPSNFVINDSLGFDFEGIIYLPNRQLIMNGGSTIRSRRMSLIADRIIINGAVLDIDPIEGSGGTTKTSGYIVQ